MTPTKTGQNPNSGAVPSTGHSPLCYNSGHAYISGKFSRNRRATILLFASLLPVAVALLTSILDYSLSFGQIAFVASIAVPSALKLIVDNANERRMKVEEIDWTTGAGKKSIEHVNYWLFSNAISFFVSSALLFFFNLSVPSLSQPNLPVSGNTWAFWGGFGVLIFSALQSVVIFHFAHWPNYELPHKISRFLIAKENVPLAFRGIAIGMVIALASINAGTLWQFYLILRTLGGFLTLLGWVYSAFLVLSLIGMPILVIGLLPFGVVKVRGRVLVAGFVLFASPVFFNLLASVVISMHLL